MKFVTNSEQETKDFGIKLAAKLNGGMALSLTGQLGAGKTTLTQGIAQGLKVKQSITSPTFTLMNVYPVKTKTISQFVHIDCYRIKNADSLIKIGILDFLYDNQTVCLVEWAEKISNLLAKGSIQIDIKILSENKREISVMGLS